MGSVEQHMEYNKNAILANQNKFQERLDVKEQEIENIKQDLQAKKRELDNMKRNFRAIRDSHEQAMMGINKDLQDTKDKLEQSEEIHSQLKTTITEKGRELDEVRKNAEDNKKMIQQLKDKFEGTEQSLQYQLKVNTQLQLQAKTFFNFPWLFQLNLFANSENDVVPVVIKLSEFEKYRYSQYVDLIEFYTRNGGYKMLLHIFPYGWIGFYNYVSAEVALMKGDHDDHLTWPVRGTLTVQLLNQLSDSNHSDPMEFHFDGSGKACQRVTTGAMSAYGAWFYQLMPHKRLSYDADKKCQYLKDDCLFFKVCNFQ